VRVQIARSQLLFDRHALGEITRLIHIRTLEIGDVISEQLQRQNREQRLEHWRRIGNQDHLVRDGTDLVIALGGDRDDLADSAVGLVAWGSAVGRLVSEQLGWLAGGL